jgi:hypothetical protein
VKQIARQSRACVHGWSCAPQYSGGVSARHADGSFEHCSLRRIAPLHSAFCFLNPAASLLYSNPPASVHTCVGVVLLNSGAQKLESADVLTSVHWKTLSYDAGVCECADTYRQQEKQTCGTLPYPKRAKAPIIENMKAPISWFFG